jgi:hypothetical protein
VRHMIRHVIKLGHYGEFMRDMARWNDEAARVGLPRYHVWDSQFGSVQEVFTMADFESIDAHYAAFEQAHGDEVFAAVQGALSSHFVDGSLHDWWLVEAEGASG